MTNANLCPSLVDMYLQRGDYRSWTFTLREADGSPLDLTGWVLHFYVDELEDPPDSSTQIMDLVGTVTDATAGVVSFALSPLNSAVTAGTYYFTLVSLLPSPTTATLVRGTITLVDDACHCLPMSDVDICNLALSFLGHNSVISSLHPPDPTMEARLCSTNYDTAVSSVLEMHAWSFALRHEDLVEATTNPREEWAYAYNVPNQLLRVLHVLPQTTRQDFPDQYSVAGKDFAIEQAESVEHDEHSHSHGNAALILYTNIAEARIRYVERCNTARLFTPLFRVAVAWHLASMLAGSLVKGTEGMAVIDRCVRMFSAYFGKAAQHDSKNRTVTPQYQVPWHAGR